MIMPTLNQNRNFTSDKTDHISYSQIKSYCMCSLKWYFSRHLEADTVSSALVFGKAWHAVVEHYYQQHMQGVTVDEAGLIKVFHSEYNKETKPITYGKSEDKDSLLEKAQQMLKVFCEKVNPGKVIAIEEKVRCEIARNVPELLGYIDLVEICRNDQGEEELVLVDFKTAARKPDKPDYNQLILYALAAHHTGLKDQYNLPLSLRFDYITKTKNPEYLQYRFLPDHNQAKRILATIRACWRGMNTAVVYPNPGWQCSGCGYKNQCGKWPESVIQARTNLSSSHPNSAQQPELSKLVV